MKQAVRSNPAVLLALIALGAVVTPVASYGTTMKCLTGTDPSVAFDAGQITAVRSQVDSQCPCANYDGITKGQKHGDYMKCVAAVVNGQATSDLRKQCKGTVKAYYAKSTCGKNPAVHFAPCVAKSSKGKVSCAIKPTTKNDGTTPSPACSSTAKTARVVCPAYTTCIDAADDNHDLLIAAPGDTGACACPSGTSACGDVCVDLSSDTNNCGGCGVTCTGGQVCASGQCGCPSGTTACGDVCVDLSTDPNNCSGCGVTCASGQVCGSGQCITTSCPNDIGDGCYWLSNGGLGTMAGCWYDLFPGMDPGSCAAINGCGSGGGCYRWTHCSACN